jgi:hypothetical protein
LSLAAEDAPSAVDLSASKASCFRATNAAKKQTAPVGAGDEIRNRKYTVFRAVSQSPPRLSNPGKTGLKTFTKPGAFGLAKA